MARLFERISTPVLTDVVITFDGVEVEAVAPDEVRGIFVDAQTLVTGRYLAAGEAEIVVRGLAADGERELVFELTFPERSLRDPAVAQLWAQQRVADLLTEARIEGPNDALIEEIVAIATDFGIVTPYTSYLVEEPQLALAQDAAAAAVGENLRFAPRDGAAAVGGAGAVEALRSGNASPPPPEAIRTAGSKSFVEADGRWIGTDFDDAETTEVTVGSEAFADLLAADPTAARAAALGPEVVYETAEGWVTIVWPEPDGAAVSEPPDVTGATNGGTSNATITQPRTGEETSPDSPPISTTVGGNTDRTLVMALAAGAALLLALGGFALRRRRPLAG